MAYKYKVGQEVILHLPEADRSYWHANMMPYVGKKFKLKTKMDKGGGGTYCWWSVDNIPGWQWMERWMRPIGCCCNIKNCITKHTYK